MIRIPIAALALALGALSVWPHWTGPTEVGVRTVKWSPFMASGVEPHVYFAGRDLFLPGIPQRLAHVRHAAPEPGDDL